MPTTRIFDAIWGHPRDVVTAGARERLLADAGLPSREIWMRAAEPDVSAQLDRRSRAAADAGVFGVPTFAVGQELFLATIGSTSSLSEWQPDHRRF